MRHDRGLEELPEHPEDCGCRECRRDIECVHEHSHMVVGETCATCGFKALPFPEDFNPALDGPTVNLDRDFPLPTHPLDCDCRMCKEENRNEADFDEMENE